MSFERWNILLKMPNYQNQIYIKYEILSNWPNQLSRALMEFFPLTGNDDYLNMYPSITQTLASVVSKALNI